MADTSSGVSLRGEAPHLHSSIARPALLPPVSLSKFRPHRPSHEYRRNDAAVPR